MFLLYSKMKREMKNFLLKWKKPLLWLTGCCIVGTVLASLGRTVRCRVGIGGDRAGYVGRKNRIQRTVDDRYCS